MILELLEKKEYDKYYAHISQTNGNETLFEHTKLVKDYFLKLIEIHQLDKVIDNLVCDFVKIYNSKDVKPAKELVESIFFNVSDFHDIGKLNPNFQYFKMENENFNKIKISFGSNHSKIGAFLFIQSFLKQANDKKYSGNGKIVNLFVVFAFSFSILNHHASKLEYRNEYIFDNEFINDVLKFIEEDIFFAFPKNIQKNIGKMFNQKIFLEVKNLFLRDSFSIFALLKLNYSLLTASDYYATTHYMNGWKEMVNDFGAFDDALKSKIIKNIEISTLYNRKTYSELENYELEFPQDATGANLNKLRQNLSVEIINGVRNNIDKNLFYIEAPTGGGKTNLSMLALAEFLRNDLQKKQNNITKVFYVFPFTTLITQTFKALKETLGLEDDEIVQIHSKAGFSEKSKDDDYGEKRVNVIDYQFVNYPISLLSHIKFFDILKSNKKSANYLIHRLANSVVIIDELQTYSPKEWDKVIYFINNYAKYFNIKFILMSATLPKIDKLLSEDAEKINFEKEKFIVLNQNKDCYFTNPNFAKRVEFDFSILHNADFNKNNRGEYLQKLWQEVEEKSIVYKEVSKNNRVHTIIEFIFKKTTTEFIEIANEQNKVFDEIFILSGTTLEPRRKEIIAKIKHNDYKCKNILLITTQVVEAGVDIDMDLGFKDSSLIDSDEQLAGRINRNVNKPQCKLYLFDLDDAKVIYGNDDRYKKIQKEFKSEYANILKTKKFDKVYDSVMDDRNELNKSDDYINLKDYLFSIKKLDFTSVDKDFKLIDNSIGTTTIYVPIEIPIDIPNSEEKNFTKTELDFLKENDKYENGNVAISGEDVWSIFEKMIKEKDEDFVRQKKKKIILQGLISKFSFSIASYSKAFKDIGTSGNGEEKYGFYYLNNVEDVYDYKTGLKTLKFEDINFW